MAATCEHCGAPVNDWDYAYCPYCGRRYPGLGLYYGKPVSKNREFELLAAHPELAATMAYLGLNSIK